VIRGKNVKLDFFCVYIPVYDQRRWVLMDIAIFLARGRGQVYARDLGILEMAAAAEDADVGA